MRIAFITESFPELSETFILGKVAMLTRAGHQVTVFTQFKKGGSVHPDLFGNMDPARDIVRLPVWDRVRGKDVARAIKAAGSGVLRATDLHRKAGGQLGLVKSLPFTRGEYDIIHAHYAYMGARYLEVMDVTGLPMVVSVLGHDLTYGDQGLREGYDRLFARVPLFFASSEYLARLAEKAGCDRAKLQVLYPEVDTKFFEYVDRSERSPTPVRLLTIGRLNWTKGFMYSLEAMRLLARQGVDFSYRIVGEGAARPEIELAIKDLGLEDKVILSGGMDRTGCRRELGWADIFVLPSVTESFGLAAAEAQATGLPVVASKVGGLPEAVADKLTGYLVPSRDPKALAEAIARLKDNPEERARMGVKGRERTERKFDAALVTESMLEAYQKVVKQWSAR